MPEWEYRTLRLRPSTWGRDNNDLPKLDGLGFDEWDLVSVVNDPEDKKGLIAFLKREFDGDDDEFDEEPGEVEQGEGVH